MEQLCKQEAVNMTAALEALSPWLKNPRRTVVQVEASTAVVIVLLLLQLIFASCRGRSSGYFVQGGTWLTYTLPFPLIAYTLGLMQSSPVKNAMYPVWATALLLAAGCTNAVKAYEIDDNKQWTRSLFDYMQYLVYASFIAELLDTHSINMEDYIHAPWNALKIDNISFPAIQLSFLIVIAFYHNKVVHCFLVDRGNLDRRAAEFIKGQATTNDDGFNPVSMKGYKYPVCFTFVNEAPLMLRIFYKYQMVLFSKVFPSFRFVSNDYITVSPRTAGKVITIDQIWQCEGRLLSSGTHCQELKDVCLAFSLYELLKRRYYGMACAEQNRPETRDFVLKGLLQNEDGYERAFQIVEAELGFCHDYFFTKSPTIFKAELFFFSMFLATVILIILIGIDVLKNSLAVMTTRPIIEVHNQSTERIITIFILATILLIQLLEAAFYVASDWFKVSVACYYIRFRSPGFRGNDCIDKLFGCLIRLTTFRTRYWKNIIDQYPIVSGSSVGVSLLKRMKRSIFGPPDNVGMLKMVKVAVAGYLRSCNGELSNGQNSLGRHGVYEELELEFACAFKGQSQGEIMLIWIIATEYLNIVLTNSEQMNSWPDERKVSVCLSRYCAYLMHSAPELLPGNSGDTKYALAVVKEKLSSIKISQDAAETCQALKNLGGREGQHNDSILMRGLALGEKLEGLEARNNIAPSWKVMADFWAEKILYIAPSDNVKGHMEHLAKGGEFLTHIWALLTHAGILEINKEHDQSTTRTRPSQENV